MKHFYMFLLILFFQSSFSQEPEKFYNIDILGNFYVGFPQKEFKSNVERNGFGINFEGFWTPSKDQPFAVGINLGFLNYGTRTRKEPFSYTIPDVFVNVTNSNNLINYHIGFMVKPNWAPFKPYVQGLFGGSYIYTETKIEKQLTNEEIATSTNFEDYAWSYGGAIGMMFRVYKSKETQKPDQVNSVWINVKASYLFGSEAEYLKEGSIKYIGSGKVQYDVLKSRTDLFGIHIGVTLNF